MTPPLPTISRAPPPTGKLLGAEAAQSQIRNFSIIAHVDHGKSTLADRLIERCGGLEQREMQEQVLDSLEIERERGITVKAQSVALRYHAASGDSCLLNLIDTPGHADFSYEVSRSLAACEGALLLVDVGQGVEAQSVAHCMKAIEQGLEILPVLNKIDLPTADIQRVLVEMKELIGLEAENAIQVSAKLGTGVDVLLERIVQQIPPPGGNPEGAARLLIVDSWFDNYSGVISLVRVVDGALRAGEKIQMMSSGRVYKVLELGIFTPRRTPVDCLRTGEVGFLIAGVKEINGVLVGDTVTSAATPAIQSLPGFSRIQPRVFAGLYPVLSTDFEALREALAKLSLNDSALRYDPDDSMALGRGFRCGFLGNLHMEIVQARLEREYDLELILSMPSVSYEVLPKTGEIMYVNNPLRLPEATHILELREPIVRLDILVHPDHVGAVISLCQARRGAQLGLQYSTRQAFLSYEFPFAELIGNFQDRLQSVSHGYASFDYSFLRFQEVSMVRLDLLLNGARVDALSLLVHRDQSQAHARELALRMKQEIPRQLFEVAVQVAVGSRILARETVKALRKNVTAKCYGGDISRKRKLLEKQKEGKKRMKKLGSVTIPQQAFMAVLSRGKSS